VFVLIRTMFKSYVHEYVNILEKMSNGLNDTDLNKLGITTMPPQ
jgi:hypothetical protein